MRSQILSLFKEMRSSCPTSNSSCASFTLKKIEDGEGVDGEAFELQLEWVPDEPSWTFLKEYASKHNLRVTTTGRLLTIYSLREKKTGSVPIRLIYLS